MEQLDCMLWARAIDSHGYGLMVVDGKQRKAHKVIYEAIRGEIPDNLVCDHLCRVRRCVNPEHIELVTNVTNVMRGVSNAALNAQKTHCKAGHKYTADNTRITPKGWRVCRTCAEVWWKRSRAKKLATSA